MNPVHLAKTALAALSLALLSSCGGEGAPAPSPSPTPSGGTGAPAPTPSPTPSPSATFTTLGQTTAQTFPSLEVTFDGEAGPFEIQRTEGTASFDVPFAIRFAGPSHLFLLLGDVEYLLSYSGTFALDKDGTPFYAEYFFGQSGHATVIRPRRHDGAYLTWTLYGSWFREEAGKLRLGDFAYGIGMPTNALPLAGQGRYTTSENTQQPIFVNFATGLVEQDFTTGTGSTLKTYSWQNVELSGDRTSFAGDIVSGGVTVGMVEGRFTGPTGEELFARFTYGPGTSETGVLVAARE